MSDLRRRAILTLLEEWIPAWNEATSGQLKYHERQKREGTLGVEENRLKLEMAAVCQRALEEQLAALPGAKDGEAP